ncbi:Zn-ribbon domain-containing OB-fold protein [Spirillospora sp. CA-142024]|uniref:Zn-ribbon domain-containing OB-fold protein n=1 Tax=Spirillospora sp. CA-142024 TaxID=3240036 RepID=UPI003D8E4DE4
MPHSHLPLVEEETRPYWDAAREGRLLIRHCEPCGEPFFYPRPFCPRCWSDRVHWIEASGRARLYTYSVVRWNDLPPFGERVPYIPAVVDLAEGPRMMTELVGCEPGAAAIGMPLRVEFRDEGEVSVPVFRPG